jgi:hypothetical protein
MFNFLKKKPIIPENEFGITPEDIRLILKDTQTWGTDEKVFDLFIEHIAKQTPVLEFQKILNSLPKKLFKLAYYFLMTRYWQTFSTVYPYKIYEDSFYYFAWVHGITEYKEYYYPRTSKLAYFYLNKIKVVK